MVNTQDNEIAFKKASYYKSWNILLIKKWAAMNFSANCSLIRTLVTCDSLTHMKENNSTELFSLAMNLFSGEQHVWHTPHLSYGRHVVLHGRSFLERVMFWSIPHNRRTINLTSSENFSVWLQTIMIIIYIL